MPRVRTMSSRPNISGIGFTDPESCGNSRNRDRCKSWLNLANVCRFVRPRRALCCAPFPLSGFVSPLRLRMFPPSCRTQRRDASDLCQFAQFVPRYLPSTFGTMLSHSGLGSVTMADVRDGWHFESRRRTTLGFPPMSLCEWVENPSCSAR